MPRNNAGRRSQILGCTIALLVVLASTAHGQALDQIVDDFRVTSGTWIGQTIAFATDLFFMLAALEFVTACLVWLISTPERRNEAAGKLVLRIMLLSFVFMLISTPNLWVRALMNTFAAVGHELAGGEVLSPSDMIDFGIAMSGKIMETITLLDVFTNLSMIFWTVIVALIVFLCYVAVAAQMVIALFEAYLLLSTGIFFLALGGSRFTAPMAENYLAYAVHVGIKLMLLYVLVAFGGPLTEEWAQLLDNDSMFSTDMTPLMRVLGGVVLLTFIVLYIPNRVASRLTSGLSFGLTQALRNV